jgi:7-cyano-7-deazaguanine synthase
MKKLCIISMSGGLDSSTLAMKAIEDGFTILPININYGQKNKVEQQAFRNIYKYFFKRNFKEDILEPINIDLTSIMKTSLDTWQSLRDNGTMASKTDMEFYTPSRNLLFTTIAAVIGEVAALATGNTEIKIGLGIHKHTQYDRDYWDITPEFVEKLNQVFALNDCMKVSMYTPYAESNKSCIVQDAIRLGVPYKMTWTCYDPIMKETPNGIKCEPCLKCEACIERQSAGELIEVHDINKYVTVID